MYIRWVREITIDDVPLWAARTGRSGNSTALACGLEAIAGPERDFEARPPGIRATAEGRR